MLTAEQVDFLQRQRTAAQIARHVWPEYAACEAALETAWGTSELFFRAKNVFGEKQHVVPVFLTITLPTWEVINGRRAETTASFIWFPSPIEAYESRMATLWRLAYPEYADALAAVTGEGFVTNVSKRWSTDPDRAAKVLAIYDAHKDVFAQGS